jgi:regulatory protein
MPGLRQRRLAAEELFEFAVRQLSGHAQSAAELRAKLQRRAARAEDVDGVISRLNELKYLDDHRFAESFAAARLENCGFGQLRVMRDLRARRVAPSVADRAVRGIYGELDEHALADEYIRRRFRFESLQDNRSVAAAYRKLLRAGFSRSTIVDALKRYAQGPEVLDALEGPEEEQEEL